MKPRAGNGAAEGAMDTAAAVFTPVDVEYRMPAITDTALPGDSSHRVGSLVPWGRVPGPSAPAPARTRWFWAC